MEFLVATTTYRPDGTPEREIERVRASENARLRELALTRQLRRLWRAPLPDDETRTVGLFEAEDTAELDKVLSAMPLRPWRTDEVTALLAHPDDPPAVGITPTPGKGPESLVTMTVMVPTDTSAQEIEDTTERQSARIRELAQRGNVVRLWTLPEQPDGPAVLGLWRARDPGDLMATLESLPMAGWLTIEVTALAPHRADPVRG